MKLSLASFALLGLPAALAAVAAELYTDSNPIPQPDYDHDFPHMDTQIMRMQLRDATPKKTTSGTASATSTAKSLTTRTSSASSSANLSTITEFAVFTVGSFGIPFTVTSISGSELVDGKVLSPGGPALLIGGAAVSEATNGALLVNGAKVPFSTGVAAASSSSSAAPPPAMTSSASGSSASSSSASAAATSSSTSSKNAAAPMVTRAAGVGAAVVGAVIGPFVF